MTLLLLLFAAFLSAQTQTPESIGPKVGQRVPDFSATDQKGEIRSLRSAFGAKGAILVFFRSADW